MKLAVFGATGGTGREVVRQALNDGHEVIILIRKDGFASLDENSRLHVVSGDLDDQATIDQS